MKKKFDDDFKYLCNVNILFNYMEDEIEFAINNKFDFADDFYILYKGVEYHIDIWVKYNEDKIELRISLDNQRYNSMADFKENAKLGEILIKNIKDNLEIALIYHDSVYLEENEIKDDKPINDKKFEYSKGLVNIYLFFVIFFSIFAIFLHLIFKGQEGAIIGFVFFDSWALFIIFMYFYYKKKKIVYKNKSFIIYGIFRKKVYLVEDIESASEQPPKGIKVRMKNGKIFKFDPYMTNQRYIKRILKQNGIEIKHIPFKNYFEFYKKK